MALRVGFCNKQYDDHVLTRLSGLRLGGKAFDLYNDVRGNGAGWTLAAIASAMLGVRNWTSGSAVPDLFANGKYFQGIEKCVNDVAGLVGILRIALRNGGFISNGISKLKVELPRELAAILRP